MSNVSADLLPKQFSALNGLLRYALPTTKDRIRARATSSMEELQEYYDAMVPHMEGVMSYLQALPADEKKLNPQDLRLLHFAKGFMTVAMAIEQLHAPDEPLVWDFEKMEFEDQPPMAQVS